MNYEEYKYSLKEFLEGIALYIFGCVVIGFYFYRSFWVSIALFPGFLVFDRFFKRKLIEKRKERLVEEFVETLNSVGINMRAGYSLENAFLEAYKDIVMFYGKNSLMASEIIRIRKGLEINITLEELLADFAKRSNVEEITMFSEVCKSAKRNGGNITEVLVSSSGRIIEAINVDREIALCLSDKKLELRIMEAVPFLLMTYLEITSGGYFDVLYRDLTGRLFMTVCLLVYIAAVLLGHRIIKIEI